MKTNHPDLSNDLNQPIIMKAPRITSKGTRILRRTGCMYREIAPLYPPTPIKSKINKNNQNAHFTTG